MNLGIDFGTTNSSLAYQATPGAAPQCVAVETLGDIPFDVILRSAVLLTQDGRVVKDGVGSSAVNPLNWFDPRSKQPRRVLLDLKPFLASFSLREQWPEVRSAIDYARYDDGRQEHQSITYVDLVTSGDIRCSREELLMASTAIFGRLFERIPSGALRSDSKIVIGVPLIFPDYAKKRLLEILVRTGILGHEDPYRSALRRVRFIPEPVGASLLYTDEWDTGRAQKERVLLFDSGGGTLDLALMEFERIDGRLRPVRQLALNARILAGRRFDQCVIDHGLAEYRARVLRSNDKLSQAEQVTDWQLAQAAESIKINLSTQESYEELSLLAAGVRPKVTRSQFEQWAAPLLQETEGLIRETVLDRDAVDTVVMVGGSSLVPCIQNLVTRLFPDARLVAEDASQRGKGEGVERALTAVSRGLSMYDDTIGQYGITPFEYGVYDAESNSTVSVIPRWTPHSREPAVRQVPVRRGTARTTLTLVQSLLESERVLNIVNAPVPDDASRTGTVSLRLRTSEGSLYPDIEILESPSGAELDAFRPMELPEVALARLIKDELHVVWWPGSVDVCEGATPFPEVSTIAKNDRVIYITRTRDGRPHTKRGTVQAIQRISDCVFYEKLTHWDITRWRIWISPDDVEHATVPFVPARRTDLRLAPSRRR